MTSPRKICVVTGTRADYGLLQGVMQYIKDGEATMLQIIATGTHLVEEFGHTVDQIEGDGFSVNKKIDMLLASDTPVSISKSMALAQIGFAEAFDELAPDVIVVLGDRYEILSAASAALISGIPLAHIHGGEVTEGAIDESIRHAVTKMSHIHFAATIDYKNRIIQMGENPDHVFHVGAPGLDHIDTLDLLDTQELSKTLQFSLDKPYGLVTYHPVTLPEQSNLDALNELLSAIDNLPDMQFIITYPNADTFGRQLIERLKDYSQNNSRLLLSQSLGQLRYLSAIKNSTFVLGNSSSGIIEAPSLGKPTINIGDRQKGRVAAESVIHCKEDRDSILNAINFALSSEGQAKAQNIVNPYRKGNASAQIFKHLLEINLQKVKRKPFFDISAI